MNQDDKEEIYSEGYSAFKNERSELSNPYSGIDAEYWSDGWEDAKEDEEQDQKRQPLKPSTVTVRKQGWDVMQRMHLPLYFRARIREMRVGDTFYMGSIRHQYDADECGMEGYEGVAEITVTKGRYGLYNIFSIWTILSKPERAMSLSQVSFKVEKGGIFVFTNESAEYIEANLKQISLTSRFMQRLMKNASDSENDAYYDLGMPPFLCGVTIDTNGRTTKPYFQRDASGSDGRYVRYKFSDDQMPRNMMECILNLGIASGEISGDAFQQIK